MVISNIQIKQFEGKGDKALALIKLQCANVNVLDKDTFHHLFTNIRIKTMKVPQAT
jgi:hypothetical protein